MSKKSPNVLLKSWPNIAIAVYTGKMEDLDPYSKIVQQFEPKNVTTCFKSRPNGNNSPNPVTPTATNETNSNYCLEQLSSLTQKVDEGRGQKSANSKFWKITMTKKLRNLTFFGFEPVWPDWAIYWTLGNFWEPLATINLPKSPTFIGNLCKGDISSEIFLGNFYLDIWRFFLVTLLWTEEGAIVGRRRNSPSR